MSTLVERIDVGDVRAHCLHYFKVPLIHLTLIWLQNHQIR